MERKEDELDFRSKSFNPEKLFAAAEVQPPDPEAKAFEDLYQFREHVHGQTLNIERELPGVLGPGGIPKAQVRASTERNFTEDQGLLKGRGPRRRRNVITRMEEIKGPLAVLRQCMEEDKRVKVYTRNHSEVRSVLTGFVVAFDKHWNLALRDVDEVFQKKIRCKKHALGDVSRYLNVGDMSIQDDHEDADDYDEYDDYDDPRQSSASKDPCPAWVAATTWGVRTSLENVQSGSRATATAPEKEGTTGALYQSWGSRATGFGGGGGGGQEWVRQGGGGEEKPQQGGGGASLDPLEERALGSRRVSRLHPDTSESHDARRLQLGHSGGGGGQEEEGEKKDGDEGEKGQKKKRRRKRKTREIRKRHVNQLLVRGENVVLVAVMQP